MSKAGPKPPRPNRMDKFVVFTAKIISEKSLWSEIWAINLVPAGFPPSNQLIVREFSWAESKLVVPGVYAVHYGLENGGEAVPINGDEPVLLSVDVGATNQVDVSIDATVLSGSTQLDASPAPGSAGDSGNIVLRSLSTGDEFVLGSTQCLLRIDTAHSPVLPS